MEATCGCVNVADVYEQYRRNGCKSDKTFVIIQIKRQLDEEGRRFLRQLEGGVFSEVETSAVHKKISHSFRDDAAVGRVDSKLASPKPQPSPMRRVWAKPQSQPMEPPVASPVAAGAEPRDTKAPPPSLTNVLMNDSFFSGADVVDDRSWLCWAYDTVTFRRSNRA